MTPDEFKELSREDKLKYIQALNNQYVKNVDLLEPEARTEQQKGTLGQFVRSAVTNGINEALFGLPRFLLDPNNRHIFKEYNTEMGQAGKTTGEFLGFLGGPMKVFTKATSKATGMISKKLIARAATASSEQAVNKGVLSKLLPTSEKGIKAASQIGGSAAGFAVSDLARVSDKDETLGDRIIGVPINAAIGGSFGIAAEVLGPVVKGPVKKLTDFLDKKTKKLDPNGIKDEIVGSVTKFDTAVRTKLRKLQQSGEFKKANELIQTVYTDTKNAYLDGMNEIKSSAVYKAGKKAATDIAYSPFVKEVVARTKGIVDEAKALPLWKKLEDYHKKAGYNWIIVPGENFVANLGKSGKAFVDGAKKIEEFKLANAGPLIAKYQRRFAVLTDQEKSMFAKVVENPTISTGKGTKLERIAAMWRKDSIELLTELKNSGYEIGEIKNYFPHMLVDHKAAKPIIERVIRDTADAEGMTDQAARKLWDSWTSWLRGKEDPYFVEWMVKNRQVDAQTVIGSMRDLVKSRSGEINSSMEALNKNFGSMLKRPLNLPFWNRDPDAVIQNYIYAQKQRVAEGMIWGPNDKRLKDILTNLGKEGSDPVVSKRVAQFLIDSMNGDMGRRHALGLISPELNEKLRGFEVITKLGLASVMNASQSVSTASFTNIRDTVKNLYKYLSSSGSRREMQIRALEMGATLEGSLSEALNGLGVDGSFEVLGKRISPRNFLKKTGFLAIEKMNRVVAAHAGRDFALRMSRELLETATVKGTPAALKSHQARALQRMGLMPKKIIYQNGRISPEEFARAARETVSSTQFSSGLLDLPLWWNSPEGKLATQFKQFSYKQVLLIKRVMLDEIAKGNYRPLITFLGAGLVIGEVASDTRSLIAFRKRNPKGFDRMLDNLSAVGAGGIFHDLIKQQAYGNTAGYLLGPAVNDLMKASEAGIQAATGKTTKAQNMLVKNIPVAGPALMNLRRSPDPQARLQQVLQGATGG